MGIKVIKGGLFTTVQDFGRRGLQKSGFHVSGAMDRKALRSANLLLGLPDREAALEFTLMGPMLEFTSDTVIAVTGGYFGPKINDEPIEMYRAVQVHSGDVLSFGFSTDGVWGYVAFAGALDIPETMGSRSTDIKSNLGGFKGRKLEDGDEISFRSNVKTLAGMEHRVLPVPVYKQDITEVRVVLGPQDDYFTEKGIATFLGTPYTVSNQCDRMGYRLEGESIEHNEQGADIISDGIAFGAIQVPAHGLPIVMLADRQTTGGYTKIGAVINADIPKLVQSRMNAQIRFVRVSVEEAQDIYVADWEELTAFGEKLEKLCGPAAAEKKTGFWKRLFGGK